MSDRTFASVTDVPCKCAYLEGSASDPNTPIRFDPELNEYHIVYSVSPDTFGSMLIYHCPFCGGLAPESRRDKLFAVVSEVETERLLLLTKGLTSAQEVIEKLGEPDEDERIQMFPGYVWPTRRDEPPSLPIRTMGYSKFSEVADINITVYEDERIETWVGPKYLGPRKQGV